ncbi:MAG: DUF1566 domain-containing protein [Deltaproteobacteria bacterium]|nr:DUF1566 domain-containing protein [Deltaproteobacteria bacterium]
MTMRTLFGILFVFATATTIAIGCGGGGDDDDDDDAAEEEQTECVDGCEDNGDGTMTCECLLWKTQDNGAALTWDDARDWAEGLDEADKSDWRLPTVDELIALYDLDRPYTGTDTAVTAYIREPFEVTKTDLWSGELDPSDNQKAYYVSFLTEAGAYAGSILRSNAGFQSALAVHDLE